MGFFSKVFKTANKIIGSPLGGLAGGLFSTNQEQGFASAQALAANQFTERQLKNKHTWQVADLRKAGLNPILSATNGAPIGGSSAASSSGNIAGSAASLLSSAAQTRQQDLNAEKLEAEINLLNSQSTKARAEARNVHNLGNITQNLGNISSGFHSLTENSSKVTNEAVKRVKEATGKNAWWRDKKFLKSFVGSGDRAIGRLIKSWKGKKR